MKIKTAVLGLVFCASVGLTLSQLNITKAWAEAPLSSSLSFPLSSPLSVSISSPLSSPISSPLNQPSPVSYFTKVIKGNISFRFFNYLPVMPTRSFIQAFNTFRNEVWAQVLSDAKGNYQFNLDPGRYLIKPVWENLESFYLIDDLTQTNTEYSGLNFEVISSDRTPLSAVLSAKSATFTFSSTGLPSAYEVDISQNPDMLSAKQAFAKGNDQTTLTVANPASVWDQYRCGIPLYYQVRSLPDLYTPIQSAKFDCLAINDTKLNDAITQGVLDLPSGVLAASTPSITAIQPLSLTTAGLYSSAVSIPQTTKIQRLDGLNFDVNDLKISTPQVSSLTGLVAGTSVKGSLKWGLDNTTLTFSKPITIMIGVGEAFNGTTLNILRSANGSLNWVTDGLVTPTCLVSTGICSFQTSKASYFAATTYTQPALPSQPAPAASSRPLSQPSAPTCSASKPKTAPTLLSATQTAPNSVTLS